MSHLGRHALWTFDGRFRVWTRAGCFWSWVFITAAFGADGDSAALARRRTPIVEAYERCRLSVVNISTRTRVGRWGINPWGDMFVLPSENSVGSGVVVHEKGYIATNAHVVAAGSDLKVTFADGKEYEAQTIGRDAVRDLAVLKIDPDEPLVPIALGHSHDLMIGETTIAIGNPVGLQNSLTTGVISALHRQLDVGSRTVYRDVIQTDASINPGNSGGALLNVLGELIGINTAIRTDAQNIGFAIPVDQLREFLPEILDPEKINRVQVGWRISAADPPCIQSVREQSPVDRAGLKVGDVIASLNGDPVRAAIDAQVTLLGFQPGETLQVEVKRGESTHKYPLTLAPTPKPDGKRLASERLGLSVADLNEKLARRVPQRLRGGVIIIAVDPGTQAAQAGLEAGDLLVMVGRHWLRDVDHLGGLLSGARTGEIIDVSFLRIVQGRLYDGDARLYAR